MRRRVASWRTSASWIFTEPLDGFDNPARMRSSVVLPAPLRPKQRQGGTGRDAELYVAQGGEVAVVFPDAIGFERSLRQAQATPLRYSSVPPTARSPNVRPSTQCRRS